MEIGLAKMSSKGQIVIPQELRKGLKEGDTLVIVKEGKSLVLKKATAFEKQLAEDLEFARRTEEAWKDVDAGRYMSMSLEEFRRKFVK